MIGFLILGGYVLGIVLSLLIVAWRKAHYLIDRFDGEMEVMAAFFWPLAIIFIIGYYILVKPGIRAFDKAVDVFTPKPPSPRKIPVVDETKSSYRNFSYEKIK